MPHFWWTGWQNRDTVKFLWFFYLLLLVVVFAQQSKMFLMWVLCAEKIARFFFYEIKQRTAAHTHHQNLLCWRWQQPLLQIPSISSHTQHRLLPIDWTQRTLRKHTITNLTTAQCTSESCRSTLSSSSCPSPQSRRTRRLEQTAQVRRYEHNQTFCIKKHNVHRCFR